MQKNKRLKLISLRKRPKAKSGKYTDVSKNILKKLYSTHFKTMAVLNYNDEWRQVVNWVTEKKETC